MRSLWCVPLLVLQACSGGPVEPDELAPVPTPPIHTPRWAFEPWISKDISDGADTRAFVQGFKDRNIPVGAVVIDSPWMSQYTTFQANPSRYPDFEGLIAELHAQGIRLVVWTTQMINEASHDLELGGDTYEGPSPNYYEASAYDYLVNGGQTYFWWKGVGGGLDFMNPEARRWWHRQQNQLLDLGLDGYKLDFGENYIPTATIATASGVISHQAYSEEYYRDFWAYGVQRRGRDFLTMVRPWDESYEFEGRFFAKKEHAPVGWVGDNRRDWFGLVDALDSMFRSAAAGYVVVGSDIGGYLDRDDDDLMVRIPFDLEVFARWTATACFTPFFQLHGRANLTPWTVPERAEEFTALYRYYATLHHELAPYYYDLAEEAYAGGPTILRAVAGPEAWKTDPRFLVGAAFLVAPPVSAGRSLSVELPSGGRYLDWWNLDGPWLDPQRLEVATPLDRIPIFVREGAIIPLAISSTVSGLVDSADAGFTVFVAPGPTTSRFVHYEDDDTRTGIEAETGAGAATVRIARVTKATRLVVRQEVASAVTLNGAALGHERWGQNGARVWVMLEPSENPVTIEIH